MKAGLVRGKTLLVTGGTGSFGQAILKTLAEKGAGPKEVRILSRHEDLQHSIAHEYPQFKFLIGDVRDPARLAEVFRGVDVVFHAAALKQVPDCEIHPMEAVKTNIMGAFNVRVAAIENDVESVVFISTDKAVKPVNVMGMTKSIQERIFARANLEVPNTRFVVVRYGNVLASRGSVIPLFHEQIKNGGPVTITHPEMTRFLLSLDEAVDLIFAAVRKAKRGETFIPRVPSARMVDVAAALIGERKIKTEVTGIRPGEKLHEILISEEEAHRTVLQDSQYVIGPILPELRPDPPPQ